MWITILRGLVFFFCISIIARFNWMLAIMLEISASMTQLNTRVYAILETHSIKETGHYETKTHENLLKISLYSWKLPVKVKMSCLAWILKRNVLLNLCMVHWDWSCHCWRIILEKKIIQLCHSTVHSVNIHITRPNDQNTHARCKVVGMATGGLGAKHRKCVFFHGREYTVLLFWRETIK